MTAGLKFPDVSGIVRVRWYRNGIERLAAAIFISMLSIIPPVLIFQGISYPADRALIIAGAALLAAVAAGVCLVLRAGIGVTPEHVLIRKATGGTEVIPWAEVTGFKAAKAGPKEGIKILVLTSRGKRWHTLGYSPGFSSPRKTWGLLCALESERLTWTPGSMSTLPPRPPEAGKARPLALFISMGILTLIALGGFSLYLGSTEIGPALRAAQGSGTAGYFIPQNEHCGRGCTWYGEFRLPNGTVTHQDVSLYNADASALRAGVPVAALDAGAGGNVFPRDDPGAWNDPAALLVISGWSYSVLLTLALRQGIRRLRPGHHYGNFTNAP